MKILLTGATGHIGHALALSLLEEDHQLTFLGRTTPQFPRNLNESFRFLKGDIVKSCLSIPEVPTLGEHDAIVHLAADLSFFGDKATLYKTNVLGTKHLLELARKLKVKKFVFSSSIEAIGPGTSPTDIKDEEAFPGWVSSYGWSKWRAEQLIRKFPLPGCEKVILRIGNVYGPGCPSFILPTIQAIRSKNFFLQALNVIGRSQFQPFYLHDVINGVRQALLPNNSGGTLNLTGNESFSLNDVFIKIASELGEKLPTPPTSPKPSIGITYKLFLENFARRLLKRGNWLAYFSFGSTKLLHRLFSSQKIREKWGFSPATSFAKGMPETIRWAKSEGHTL